MREGCGGMEKESVLVVIPKGGRRDILYLMSLPEVLKFSYLDKDQGDVFLRLGVAAGGDGPSMEVDLDDCRRFLVTFSPIRRVHRTAASRSQLGEVGHSRKNSETCDSLAVSNLVRLIKDSVEKSEPSGRGLTR